MDFTDLLKELKIESYLLIFVWIIFILYILYTIYLFIGVESVENSIQFILNKKNKYNGKKVYYNICKELNIDNIDAKTLEPKVIQYYTKDTNNFKNYILTQYNNLIIDKLRLHECDGLLSDFINQHLNEISVFKSLLDDKHYKYHSFLLENSRCFINSLIEPFVQLDNISNLDISDKQKKKEFEELKIEIYKAYTLFFNIIKKLNEADNLDTNLQNGQIINSQSLNNLKKYNELLNSIDSDMEKHRGIF